MTLVIIHDTEKQLAALVEPDALYSVVPVMAGPDAVQLLEDFMAAVPFDLADLSITERGSAWDAYVKRQTGQTPGELLKGAEPAPVAPGAAAPAAVIETPDRTREPAAAAPGGAPADTDPTAASPPVATAGPETSPGGSSPTDTTTPATAPATATEPATDSPPQSAEPAPATATKECPVCHGAGTLVSETDAATGQCGYCQGTGKVEVPA